MLTRGRSDRLTPTFYLVAIMNFRVRLISADSRATRIKIKIEPSSTQCVGAPLVGQYRHSALHGFSMEHRGWVSIDFQVSTLQGFSMERH